MENVASWPTRVIEDVDAKAESEMGIIQEVISAVRNIRSELRVPPGKKINVVISAGGDMLSLLSNQAGYIQVCSQASEVKVGENVQKPPSSGSAVIKDIELYVPLEGLIDIDEESRRIQKEIDKFTKLLNGIESKLNQEKFLSKAPQDVIDRERERKKEYTESLSKLEDSLSTLIN